MSATDHQPIFERLTRLLDPLDPAELHGLLCGLLCADPGLSHEQWLAHASEDLIEDLDLPEATRSVLLKLFDYGEAQLKDPDGAATPLLPDDETPLQQRTRALAVWCQGFLYGLGLGETSERGRFSPESQEFLRDATEIARVGFDADEADEADEIAYAEVVEYLRVGLLLIQQDLRFAAPAKPYLH
ncbi:MAG: UPF0149 family protein [Candidatus Competibacteraceae bacterium]|nr:UPF0149 family protein [Candidatus Competibacteraceae bacterium]